MISTAPQTRFVARPAIIAPEAPTQTLNADVPEAKQRVHTDGIMMQGKVYQTY
jgi:hypothetical protein